MLFADICFNPWPYRYFKHTGRSDMKKQNIFKSTIVRIISAIILLVLPVNVLTLFLSAKAIESSKNQSISDAQYILNMAQSNIESSLYRLDRKLISLRLFNGCR